MEDITARAALVLVEASSDTTDFIIMLAGCAIWLKRDLACGLAVHVLSTAVTAGKGFSLSVVSADVVTYLSVGWNSSSALACWASAFCFDHSHIISSAQTRVKWY